jgi:phage terminase small subunit
MEGSEPLANARHERFAQELAKGSAIGAAYEAAGYKESPASASRLSQNIKIEQRVRYLTASAAERVGVTIEGTLLELQRIVRSDIRRMFDENGNLRRVEDLDDDTAAALSSIEVVARPVQGGERGEVEYVHKFKTYDKNSAIDKMMKHLGLLSDGKVELSGPGGGPIATSLEVQFVDPDE